jgi:flagella basal body P-ring formation protein FlgA
VRQGAEVQVVVRSGNVTVQALGVVQEAGALGEAVRVLPQGSARVVRGRVLDARTIEVLL